WHWPRVRATWNDAHVPGITAHDSDVPILEERQERGIVPTAPARTRGRSSHAEQKRITWAHFHASLPLPRFDVFTVHVRPGFKGGEIAQAWDVDQHAAGDDSILHVVDAQVAPLLRRHRLKGNAVVELPLVRHMTQGVDMCPPAIAMWIDILTIPYDLPLRNDPHLQEEGEHVFSLHSPDNQ